MAKKLVRPENIWTIQSADSYSIFQFFSLKEQNIGQKY